MSELNIMQRLFCITSDMNKVAKNLNIGNYKAVGEDDILKAVKPLEEKYRVYSYPCDREVTQSEVLDTVNKYSKQELIYFSRIKTTYRFVNIDKPSDYIDMVSVSEGIDKGDKGSGKSMTYGDKYALMKAYKIRTGEDADNEESQSYSRRNNDLPLSDAERNQTEREVMDHIFMKCKQDKVNSRIVMSMLLTNAGVKSFNDIKVIKEKDVKKMVKDAMIKLDIEYK